ncbi:MAG: HlyD family secretion protein [Mangrovibacterium sp.]
MKKNQKSKWLVAVLLVSVVVALALWFMFKPKVYYIQGQVEAAQIRVSPEIPGKVLQLLVKEGDTVVPGQVLALMKTSTIDAKLQQAQAAHAAASAQLEKADAGARVEQITAAYNLWQQAEAASELADKTYERVNNLYAEKVLPAQKRDEAYTQKVAMRKQADAAKANYEMAKSGTRTEDKKAAAALVQQAQGAVNEVESYLSEARVVAPSAGEVQEVIPAEGELVNAGYPIVNLVDLTDTWVIINIREDMMNHFRKGFQFEAMVPALGNQKIQLEVRNIAPLADFATWTATRAQGDFDRRTFQVKAYPTANVDGLRPGMSVLIDQSIAE